MKEKTFEVRYVEINPNSEPHDVSFELSEDAEDVLFNAIADRLYDQARDGTFDGETVHLYKRLSDQQESHPPWIEVDADRTYDLAITDSQYRILTSIIGEQLKNVLGPEGADSYRDLIHVWESITDQMSQQSVEDAHRTLDQFDGSPDYDKFVCLLYDGVVSVYETEDGRIYRCNECNNWYDDIDTDHECIDA